MPGNIVETQPAATETQPASALADTRPSIEGTFQSFDALRARVTLASCSSGRGFKTSHIVGKRVTFTCTNACGWKVCATATDEGCYHITRVGESSSYGMKNTVSYLAAEKCRYACLPHNCILVGISFCHNTKHRSLGEKYTAACLIADMKEKGVVIKKDTAYRALQKNVV